MMYIDDDVMEGNLHSESDTLDFSQKNCDENSRMRKISYSKSPANVRACADSRRDFWTTNWKSIFFLPFELAHAH